MNIYHDLKYLKNEVTFHPAIHTTDFFNQIETSVVQFGKLQRYYIVNHLN